MHAVRSCDPGKRSRSGPPCTPLRRIPGFAVATEVKHFMIYPGKFCRPYFEKFRMNYLRPLPKFTNEPRLFSRTDANLLDWFNAVNFKER